MSRRSVVKATALLSAAGMMAIGKPVFAQDATPGAATPEAGATPSEATLPAIPPEVEQYANDWPMFHQNYASTRVAPDSTIDASTVSQLGVAWESPITASAPFGAVTSNPIVLGERVYLIDNNGNVAAIDRTSGETIWKVENGVPTDGPNGVAVGYGTVIGVLGDTAQVQALDPETGEQRWITTLSAHGSLGITVAPIIHDGVVIVSTAPGGNPKGRYGGGANGIVYALDITNGVVAWSWDTVTDNLWDNFRVNSGGGLWYPPAIDTETGVLFMGIGNAAPFSGSGPESVEYPNRMSRPGENLYANCLVALDPAQGRVLWYLNVKPHDVYDHDNQQTPVLGTVKIGGQDADMVFTSGKHGYVAAVHRSSGQEVWRRAVGKHMNDGLSVLPDELIDVYPGLWGGVQSPMAFADGVLYAIALNWSTQFSATGIAGISAEGFDLTTSTSTLIALDGATGDYIWQTELPIGVAGSGPVIANDLVFVGSLDGVVRAFTIADGKQVWMTQASAGINAPFAIAGDMLLVPAGSFIVPSSDSPNPVPGLNLSLIAYKVGATGTVTYGAAQTTSSTPAASADGSAVTVHAIDLGYNPTSLSIAADTDVTITLVNDGVLQHDLAIEGTEFTTKLLGGGESAELVVNLPAGTYTYYCTVEGHRQAGMQGMLTVG
ncbi:MAG: PQQ-binding-like beta-propeller repeat protein [Thermomicrobiales bacterium]